MAMGRDAFQLILDFIENHPPIGDVRFLVELYTMINRPEFSKDQLHTLNLAAIKKYALFISLIPPAERDKELCLAAVNQSPIALIFVPNELIDRDEFKYALQYCYTTIPTFPPALEWLPVSKRTYELFESSISSPRSISYIVHLLNDYKKNTPLSEDEYRKLIKKIDSLNKPPSIVDPADMKPNYKLLSDEEIQRVRKVFDRRRTESSYEFLNIRKAELSEETKLNIKYSCIESNGELYAIYHGKKQNKQIGEGKRGTVKLAQNLYTGEWCALKVSGEYGASAQETTIAKELGLAIAAGEAEGKEEWRYKILMKLIPGQDLKTIFENGEFENYPVIDRVKLAINLFDRLSNMHNNNIAHCDLFPSQIIVDKDNMRVEVIDFGQSLKCNPETASKKMLETFRLNKSVDVINAFSIIANLFGLAKPSSSGGRYDLIEISDERHPDPQWAVVLSKFREMFIGHEKLQPPYNSASGFQLEFTKLLADLQPSLTHSDQTAEALIAIRTREGLLGSASTSAEEQKPSQPTPGLRKGDEKEQ